MNVNGERLVREITISDVRALVRSFPGKPHTARLVKAVLGSLYSTMVDEEIVETNPTRGIKVPKVDHTTFAALTPDDFKTIVEHLPSPQLRFFAQFLVGSGLRYGEAAALHVEDFNYDTKEIVVRRRLTEVSKKQSGRDTFAFTQPSTKSGHSRVVPLSPALADGLQVLMNSYPNEVIFGADVMFPPQDTMPQVGAWWWTPDYVAGKKAVPIGLQHGTLGSYRTGQCRCDLCKQAEAYERSKSTRKRSVYMERKRWDGVWKAAVKAAGLSWSPRTHDLRH